MITDTQMRKIESEEAAALQSFLTTHYPECRPEYPAGIFAWALNALQKTDQDLVLMVQAAMKRSKKRDPFVHAVLNSVANFLTK